MATDQALRQNETPSDAATGTGPTGTRPAVNPDAPPPTSPHADGAKFLFVLAGLSALVGGLVAANMVAGLAAIASFLVGFGFAVLNFGLVPMTRAWTNPGIEGVRPVDAPVVRIATAWPLLALAGTAALLGGVVAGFVLGGTMGLGAFLVGLGFFGLTTGLAVMASTWAQDRREDPAWTEADQAEPEPTPETPEPLVRIDGDEDQHVITIEGIGSRYASRLNSHGIITVPQLIETPPRRIAQACDVTGELAGLWQSQGMLMRIPGIGPQYAELLVAAGIERPRDLADADPARLMQRIRTVQSDRSVPIQGGRITEGLVARWIEAAQGELLATA